MIIDFLKRVIRTIRKDDLKKILNTDIAISDKMSYAIALWTKLYKNHADWLNEDTKSLNLPSSIATELARLVTVEMKSEISGSIRADYLNEQYMRILPDLRNVTEYACAKGGIILKPYISGEGINVDYVQADSFIPTCFDSSGDITGAVFMDKKYKGNKIYTRLEYHRFEKSKYVIDNRVYVSTSESDIGKRTSLKEVEEWADLSPTASIDGLDKPLFAYFKMPMANPIDGASHIGVSVYAKAIELIKQADIQFSRLLWEFESGERALYVDDMALKRDSTTGKYEIPNKRLYRMLNSDESLFEDWTPTLREENIISGLNTILRKIEFNVGLAYGTLSDVNYADKTAEEIRSSKERSYVHVCDIQNALKTALSDLIYAMDVLATLYSLAPQGEYDISFEFDDSIVADRRVEFTEKMQLVSAGIMQAWEFRVWYFGEDEETAKANAAKDEGVPEV